MTCQYRLTPFAFTNKENFQIMKSPNRMSFAAMADKSPRIQPTQTMSAAGQRVWHQTVVAQIQGHKPSATAEKHYKRRPLDLLRVHHERIEAWVLEQARVEWPRKLLAVSVKRPSEDRSEMTVLTVK